MGCHVLRNKSSVYTVVAGCSGAESVESVLIATPVFAVMSTNKRPRGDERVDSCALIDEIDKLPIAKICALMIKYGVESARSEINFMLKAIWPEKRFNSALTPSGIARQLYYTIDDDRLVMTDHGDSMIKELLHLQQWSEDTLRNVFLECARAQGDCSGRDDDGEVRANKATSIILLAHTNGTTSNDVPSHQGDSPEPALAEPATPAPLDEQRPSEELPSNRSITNSVSTALSCAMQVIAHDRATSSASEIATLPAAESGVADAGPLTLEDHTQGCSNGERHAPSTTTLTNPSNPYHHILNIESDYMKALETMEGVCKAHIDATSKLDFANRLANEFSKSECQHKSNPTDSEYLKVIRQVRQNIADDEQISKLLTAQCQQLKEAYYIFSASATSYCRFMKNVDAAALFVGDEDEVMKIMDGAREFYRNFITLKKCTIWSHDLEYVFGSPSFKEHVLKNSTSSSAI